MALFLNSKKELSATSEDDVLKVLKISLNQGTYMNHFSRNFPEFF